MKITLDWLGKQDACDEGVTWWESCGETDGAAVVRLLMAADFEEALLWANWLIVRLLNRPGRIRYAINAAESVLDCAGSSRPQAEAAIAAAKAVLAADGEEIRQTAARAASAASDASWAASAASDASWVASDAARNTHLRRLVEFGLGLLEGK